MRVPKLAMYGVLPVVAVTVMTLLIATTVSSDSHILVHDTFSGRGNTPIDGRFPDTLAAAGPWSVEDGDWAARGGVAIDNTKVKELFAGDRRATIDTGSSDIRVTASIKRTGGGEFQGVVGRYAGPTDWIMVFYDGVGDIVLGAKESSEGGGFQELGRVPVRLKNGSQHELTLNLTGDSVAVFLNGEQILPRGGGEILFDGHRDATRAGIFLRGNGSSRFNEFTVTRN